MKERYLGSAVSEDLAQKMVFLGGPRQVGKTTLGELVAAHCKHPCHLNWDSRSHRRTIMDGQWSPDCDILIFDEIHKYRRWKTLVKGIWDTRSPGLKIMVTGSSRLDVYRRGGDSLQGRYHYYRLHPFTLHELSGGSLPAVDAGATPPPLEFGPPGTGLEHLMKFGGFPEPCLAGNERTLRRWQRQRFERVFHEDIRDVETVHALSEMELLGAMLPERVAAPLSFNGCSRRYFS